jgi:hypothetical protein
MQTEKLKSGLTAGFVATVVLSLALALKASMGLVPALDPTANILALGDLMTGTRLPASFGWIVHLLIGTFIGGGLYAAVEPFLPGAPLLKGVLFGLIVWIALMFVGASITLQVVIAALILSLVYGATLAMVYANLGSAAARDDLIPR